MVAKPSTPKPWGGGGGGGSAAAADRDCEAFLLPLVVLVAACVVRRVTHRKGAAVVVP